MGREPNKNPEKPSTDDAATNQKAGGGASPRPRPSPGQKTSSKGANPPEGLRTATDAQLRFYGCRQSNSNTTKQRQKQRRGKKKTLANSRIELFIGRIQNIRRSKEVRGLTREHLLKGGGADTRRARPRVVGGCVFPVGRKTEPREPQLPPRSDLVECQEDQGRSFPTKDSGDALFLLPSFPQHHLIVLLPDSSPTSQFSTSIWQWMAVALLAASSQGLSHKQL